MAAFDFDLAFYAYADFNAEAQTQDSVSLAPGTNVTLNPAASVIVANVTDDDGNDADSPLNQFSDGYIDAPGNGATPNTANNDQLLTNAVSVNETTYPAGSQVELEFAFTTTTGETFWVIRIAGTNVGISGPSLPTPGTSYTVAASADGSATPITSIPCFTAGTKILTSHGLVSVEDLDIGTLVQTADGGFKPLRWTGSRYLSAADIARNPKLRPIRIQAGALGSGIPTTDLIVSPQHRILVRSRIAQKMFGTEEVLVAARQLLQLDGIDIVEDCADVRYVHIMFEQHELVVSNGAMTESLFAGSEALRSVGAQAREEIFALFPQLQDNDFQPVAIRTIVSNRQGRQLAMRHKQNSKALVI